MKRRLMQRQVQVAVLTAVVILALVVVSFVLLDIAKIKDEVGTVQSVITSVAILVGGAFAIFKFQLFRDFEPHLSISQEVSHRFISEEYVHIAVTSTLNSFAPKVPCFAKSPFDKLRANGFSYLRSW